MRIYNVHIYFILFYLQMFNISFKHIIRVTGLTEELQVIKRMYQCCLEAEQILKKEKQKAVEDVWTLKAAYSKEMENLLKIQVHKKIYPFILFTN